jgi:hypothetical protein
MSERSIIEGLRKSLIVIGVESENITCPNEWEKYHILT